MKKIVVYLISSIITLLIILIAILSTAGIETNKFNKLISEKASKTKNIYLDLETIKFKINPKELSLFIETRNPEITYKGVTVPVQNVKLFIDFFSLIKSNPQIKKAVLVLKELDITQLNQLSVLIKPSNFKSLINNKVKEGKLISEIEIFLTEQGNFKDFIAKGTVKGLKAELFNNLNLTKTNLGFFADKNDILIKNIFGNLEDVEIFDGDIKLNLEKGIKLNSNFKSKINFDEKLLNKYTRFFNNYKLFNNIKNLKATFNNNISINLDKTYKVKDYNYSISGNLDKAKIELSNPVKIDFFQEEIKTIHLVNLKIDTMFNPKNNNLKGEGTYSLNSSDYLKVNFNNNFNNNSNNLKLNFGYGNSLELDLINYKKTKETVANFVIDLEKKKENIKINKFNFEENNNLISIYGLVFKNNKFSTFKSIKILTKNNDFSIQKDKKIKIKGSKFDATNLSKFLSNQKSGNILQNLSSDIEIDFASMKVPMSENLSNFKLIGEIKKGRFTKISSKGDFGGNNFLDISMKKDKNTNKKYLEIYSDLTRPLLTEYSFFNGLSGGKLLFTSIIDDLKSNSKLKIENFKVVNAPGVIKLLSLADLGGLVDLTEGEGLSFDILEIDMEKNKNFLKLNEILALGPSISVLMEGYQDESGTTSLRGTLVPAKTLNKMISKIPVIGNIVIPKEVGEGLFGVSFKMKGPKGKIKTTINPIKTLTPRFIQKIIDRNKTPK